MDLGAEKQTGDTRPMIDPESPLPKVDDCQWSGWFLLRVGHCKESRSSLCTTRYSDTLSLWRQQLLMILK